jgi:hypothetical protein
LIPGVLAAALACGQNANRFPNIPADYLRQADHIPEFWIASYEEVSKYLETRVHKGEMRVIGKSAGGRPMRAVFYGKAREGRGTTNFSGGLGCNDVRAYLGSDYAKKVYMVMAGIHGAEFEGMAGAVNLISVLETGRDLRGKAWPEITAVAGKLDRIVVIPITNVDGRARVPLRMMVHRGPDYTIPEYFNTGGWPDGKLIGWPAVKRFIPLDFSRTQFPGGYPNDAGVNIQHDDFFSPKRQPETQALFDLAERERPDLIMNMHTGAQFVKVLRPFLEPVLTPIFEALYRRVLTRLTEEGLEPTKSVGKEADPSGVRMSPYNLDTALNLHCGALSLVVESPSHAANSGKRDGQLYFPTPDELVTAQLLVHTEAMEYLADTGGRANWTPVRK